MEKVDVKNNFGRLNVSSNTIERLNFLIGFIGTNRTGKTTVAREIAKKWIESRNGEGLVQAFDPQRQFEGLKDIDIDPTDNNWADNCMQYPNSLVILDDYRALHIQNTPLPGLIKLMHYRSHLNIDIMYITHNPKLVLNTLSYYTTHYYIFYTQVQNGSFESKIPNYEQCMAASKFVNEYVKANGRGEYPRFPYMLVDNEKGDLKAFNMNKPLK